MSIDCLWFFQKHAFASAPVQILRVWSVYVTEGYALGIDSVKSLCLFCSCQMNFLMGTIELCPLMKDRPDERPPLFQDHFWLLVTFSPSYFGVNKLLTKDHPSVQTTFFSLFFLWWCHQGPSLCPDHHFFLFSFFLWWCYKRGVPQYFIASSADSLWLFQGNCVRCYATQAQGYLLHLLSWKHSTFSNDGHNFASPVQY